LLFRDRAMSEAGTEAVTGREPNQRAPTTVSECLRSRRSCAG